MRTNRPVEAAPDVLESRERSWTRVYRVYGLVVRAQQPEDLSERRQLEAASTHLANIVRLAPVTSLDSRGQVAQWQVECEG